MSKFMLSKAMGNIPDAMLQEAMEVKTKSRTGWVIFRAAACLAVVIGLIVAALGLHANTDDIVTGPGILSITAHAMDGEPYAVASPDMVAPPEFVSKFWGNGVNWAPGWPFTLSLQGDAYTPTDIHFEVSVDGGGYWVGTNGGTSIYPGNSKKLPSKFTIPNHTTIFWSQWYDAATGEQGFPNCTVVYTKIVVYDGEQIIGYAVMRFDRLTYAELNADGYGEEYSNQYRLSALDSVSFPKVDGEYQNITLEYVEACIAKLCMN